MDDHPLGGPPSRYHGAPDSQDGSHDGLRVPAARARRSRSALSKEERTERKERYDRIDFLTRELSSAIRDEMARRKDLWDVDGGREEEEFWEFRKQDVYKGLEQLADEINRALRDRRKEAVLDLWSKEIEERRLGRAGGAAFDRDGC